MGRDVVTSEDELLANATQGDAAALGMLLESHGLSIRQELKISPKWLGVVDADDVMQVTYLEAFLRILDFQPTGPGAFLPIRVSQRPRAYPGRPRRPPESKSAR